MVLLIAAAAVAYGQAEAWTPDILRQVAEAGPAAAAVCYFLWRLERAIRDVGKRHENALGDRAKDQTTPRDGRDST